MRHDAYRGPLRRPYDGPFPVLEPGEKDFLIDLGGRAERVSVDRLKPAHLDLDKPANLALPLGLAILTPGLAARVIRGRALLFLWICLRLGPPLGGLGRLIRPLQRC